MRVLLIGDVHGQETAVRVGLRTAAAYGADLAVQLGDFGLADWGRVNGAQKYLDGCQRYAAKYKVPLVALRGNHDDEPLWAALIEGQDPNEYGAISVRNNVSLLPRSGGVKWGTRNVAWLGGAFSVDYEARVHGQSWWPTEVPTEEDLSALEFRADILLTHDAAKDPPIPDHYRMTLRPALKVRAESHRYWIKRAVEITNPTIHFHGHWHYGYAEPHPYRHLTTVGLANLDGTWKRSVALLDTDSLSVEWVRVV